MPTTIEQWNQYHDGAKSLPAFRITEKAMDERIAKVTREIQAGWSESERKSRCVYDDPEAPVEIVEVSLRKGPRYVLSKGQR